MNILLLNFTRFGDLLQSQATITDLTKAGHNVALVCLNNFEGATALLKNVDLVAPFGADELLRLLHTPAFAEDASNDFLQTPQNKWAVALVELATWREKIRENFAYDLVCNMTPSLAARLLSRFLAKEKPLTGFAIDEQGFAYTDSPWASFFEGASLSRGVSPFNIVDVFRRIVLPKGTIVSNGNHLGDASKSNLFNAIVKDNALGDATLAPITEQAKNSARALLVQQTSSESKGYIGFQLGASEENRRWPIAFFVALGDAIWQKYKLTPVLLGSKNEKVLAKRYVQKAQHAAISLCGKTSLAELAGVIDECSLIVSNDTGTMHLAAGLTKPVFGIFLATAQPFDTGPYCEGSISFEPDYACHPCSFGVACAFDHKCRKKITPEVVFQYVTAVVEQNKMPIVEQKGVRIWQAAYDVAGFMNLQSLSAHELEDRTQWLFLQRCILRQFLDRKDIDSFTLTFDNITFSCSKTMRETMLEEAHVLHRHLELLVQQGHLLLQNPMDVLQKKFMRNWEKIYELLHTSSYFLPLGLLWRNDTQTEGKTFAEVVSLIKAYSAVFSGIKTLLEGVD